MRKKKSKTKERQKKKKKREKKKKENHVKIINCTIIEWLNGSVVTRIMGCCLLFVVGECCVGVGSGVSVGQLLEMKGENKIEQIVPNGITTRATKTIVCGHIGSEQGRATNKKRKGQRLEQLIMGYIYD